MPAISEIMTTEVATLTPDDSTVAAARLMRDLDIGDVVLTDGDRPVGIVTDRDLVVRGLAEGGDGTKPLREVCSSDLTVIDAADDAGHAVEVMREQALRRLPVVEAGRLVGVVSIGDLAIEQDGEAALADISAASPNN